MHWAQAFIAEALVLPDIVDRALLTFTALDLYVHTNQIWFVLIDMPHCVAVVMA